MAHPLADFQGDAIYVDTNVLVGLVDANSVYHPACAPFFQRAVAPTRPIQLFTATLTLDEVVFVLLQELVARDPYRIVRNRSQYLRDHPNVVRALMEQVDPLAARCVIWSLWNRSQPLTSTRCVRRYKPVVSCPAMPSTWL